MVGCKCQVYCGVPDAVAFRKILVRERVCLSLYVVDRK